MNNILKINKIASVSEAADIPSAFAAAKVPYNVLGTLNWPETHPYKPQVSFALAHCSDAILLHYKVSEQSVLARCSADRERVSGKTVVSNSSFPPSPETVCITTSNSTA